MSNVTDSLIELIEGARFTSEMSDTRMAFNKGIDTAIRLIRAQCTEPPIHETLIASVLDQCTPSGWIHGHKVAAIIREHGAAVKTLETAPDNETSMGYENTDHSTAPPQTSEISVVTIHHRDGCGFGDCGCPRTTEPAPPTESPVVETSDNSLSFWNDVNLSECEPLSWVNRPYHENFPGRRIVGISFEGKWPSIKQLQDMWKAATREPVMVSLEDAVEAIENVADLNKHGTGMNYETMAKAVLDAAGVKYVD